MENVEAMNDRLLTRTLATESGVDGGRDACLESPSAGIFGFPYIDVPQCTTRLADAQVQEGAGQRFGADLVDDFAVEIFPDGDVLDVGVNHLTGLLIY